MLTFCSKIMDAPLYFNQNIGRIQREQSLVECAVNYFPVIIYKLMMIIINKRIGIESYV